MPGESSWLALVMSRATFSKDFTVGVTRGLYDYEKEDMVSKTDDIGRPVPVQGKLSLNAAGGDTKLQRSIGKGPNAKDSDVGFHLIADSLGGPTNKLNVLPGNGKSIDDGLANLNTGEYATMEKRPRGALNDGKDVDIEIQPIYKEGDSTRPERFEV